MRKPLQVRLALEMWMAVTGGSQMLAETGMCIQCGMQEQEDGGDYRLLAWAPEQ